MVTNSRETGPDTLGAYFFEEATGLPSLTQVFHPPSSALIFFTP
jgi:hypothetical protein